MEAQEPEPEPYAEDYEISDDDEPPEQDHPLTADLTQYRGKIPDNIHDILTADVAGESMRGFNRTWVEDKSQKVVEGQPVFEKQKAKDRKAGIAPTPVLNLPAGGFFRFDRKHDDEYQTKPSKEGWGIHDPLGHDGQDTFFKHPSVFRNEKGEIKRWVDFRRSKANAHIPDALMAKKADKRALDEADEYLKEMLYLPMRDKRIEELESEWKGDKWRAIRKMEGGEVQREMDKYDEEVEYHDINTGRVKRREMGWADLKKEPAKEYKRGGDFEPEKGEVRYRRTDQPKPEQIARDLDWLEPTGEVSNVHMAGATPEMNQKIRESGVSAEGSYPVLRQRLGDKDWNLQHIHERIEETGHWGQRQWEYAIASSTDSHMVHTGKINPTNPSKRIKHELGGGAVNKGIPGVKYEDERETQFNEYMDELYLKEREEYGGNAIDLREVPVHIPELRDMDGQIVHKAQSYPGIRYGQFHGAYETGQVQGDVIQARGEIQDPERKILHHGVWAEVEKVRAEMYQKKIHDLKEARALADKKALVALNPAVASGEARIQDDGKVVSDTGVVYNPQGKPTGEVVAVKKKLGFAEWMVAQGDISDEEDINELDAEELTEFQGMYERAGGVVDDEIISEKAGGAEEHEWVDDTGPDAGNRIFNVQTGLGAGRFKKG